mgnify:CR=1 FL=1
MEEIKKELRLIRKELEKLRKNEQIGNISVNENCKRTRKDKIRKETIYQNLECHGCTQLVSSDGEVTIIPCVSCGSTTP